MEDNLARAGAFLALMGTDINAMQYDTGFWHWTDAVSAVAAFGFFCLFLYRTIFR